MAKNVPIIMQITCVERELHMRRRCYPRWVQEGRMKAAKADEELAAMEAVLDTLRLVHLVILWAADTHPNPRLHITQAGLFDQEDGKGG